MVKDVYGQKWNHPWKYYAQQYKMAPLSEIEKAGISKYKADDTWEGLTYSVAWDKLTLKEKRVWVAWVGNHNFKLPPST